MNAELIPTWLAANMLHVTQQTVQRYVRKGYIRGSKLPGGQYRVLKSDIERIRDSYKEQAS